MAELVGRRSRDPVGWFAGKEASSTRQCPLCLSPTSCWLLSIFPLVPLTAIQGLRVVSLCSAPAS